MRLAVLDVGSNTVHLVVVDGQPDGTFVPFAGERGLVANVARYHRKALPSDGHPDYMALDDRDRMLVRRLAALLRLADGLDADHFQVVEAATVVDRGDHARLELRARDTPRPGHVGRRAQRRPVRAGVRPPRPAGRGRGHLARGALVSRAPSRGSHRSARSQERPLMESQPDRAAPRHRHSQQPDLVTRSSGADQCPQCQSLAHIDRADWNQVVRGETELQADDRHFNELLQELRVAQTGVQILFAFLLGLAFTARFPDLTGGQQAVWLATLVLSAVSAALLIGPVGYHRTVFRQRLRPQLVKTGHRYAIAGLILLLLALSGAVLLAASFVIGPWASLLAASLAGLFATLWFAVPLVHRVRHRRHPAQPDPGPPA